MKIILFRGEETFFVEKQGKWELVYPSRGNGEENQVLAYPNRIRATFLQLKKWVYLN